jgi:hypothetical protein
MRVKLLLIFNGLALIIIQIKQYWIPQKTLNFLNRATGSIPQLMPPFSSPFLPYNSLLAISVQETLQHCFEKPGNCFETNWGF